MGTADDLRDDIEVAAAAFLATLDGRDLEAPTPSGWTVKEMVAHVAFWLETTPPFVTGAFRGDESAFEVTFPSGFVPSDDGAWPPADVHNAREAAWAREQAPDVVVQRLREAHRRLGEFLVTVTDEEASEHADYYRDIAHHLDAHRIAELADP
ncbi:MAG TPA: maleylpyruvate isomerase N-terminal domain-containing protein [Acidimicrobiales bacterium]|nr:maleylpyruvate isomerase N-terminal domain-containing protein [Acidimicrobiales bacterium]